MPMRLTNEDAGELQRTGTRFRMPSPSHPAQQPQAPVKAPDVHVHTASAEDVASAVRAAVEPSIEALGGQIAKALSKASDKATPPIKAVTMEVMDRDYDGAIKKVRYNIVR